MQDGIIKGVGNSRYLKSVPSFLSLYPTYEAFCEALISGTLPIDLNGINEAGWTQTGTPLNKGNMLTDATAAALELTSSDPTVNEALYALSQKVPSAEARVLGDVGTTVTMTRNGKSLSATVASTGYATLYPTELGDWTIVYTFNGSQKTRVYTLEVIGIVTVYPFVIGDSLNETGWSDINLCASLGMAERFFKVGDTKTVNIGGTDYDVQIIGFNHDTKTAGGKAIITFQMVGCLNATARMNSSNTNSGGWNSSAMRTQMSTYLSQLPSDLQSVIKAVNKLSGTGGGSTSGTQTTSDKLFLLSDVEIFGITTYSVSGEGSQYDFYKAGNSTIKKVNGSKDGWWARSPRSGNSDGFCAVGSSGAATYGDAIHSYGVSFGFCV